MQTDARISGAMLDVRPSFAASLNALSNEPSSSSR